MGGPGQPEDQGGAMERCTVCGKIVAADDQPRWGVPHGGYMLTAHDGCWNPELPDGPQIRFLDARWSEAARAQHRLRHMGSVEG